METCAESCSFISAWNNTERELGRGKVISYSLFLNLHCQPSIASHQHHSQISRSLQLLTPSLHEVPQRGPLRPPCEYSSPMCPEVGSIVWAYGDWLLNVPQQKTVKWWKLPSCLSPSQEVDLEWRHRFAVYKGMLALSQDSPDRMDRGRESHSVTVSCLTFMISRQLPKEKYCHVLSRKDAHTPHDLQALTLPTSRGYNWLNTLVCEEDIYEIDFSSWVPQEKS